MLFKYHAIKVGVCQKLTFTHMGGGGVWRGAKSAHAILEQPHILEVVNLGILKTQLNSKIS